MREHTLQSRASLAKKLSYLRSFEHPDIKEEQYATDSEIAATLLWHAFMLRDIKEKTVADLGAGTGILGIGALFLGAKKVFFIEKDARAIAILTENVEKQAHLFRPKTMYEIEHADVLLSNKKSDCVIMNPPFGTKQKHADILFLEKAFTLAPVVYSIHKESTRQFLQRFGEQHGFILTHVWTHAFPLKKTMGFHTKKKKDVAVCLCRFGKQKND